MIEHIARYPRLRDRAVFVGDPDDIVPDAFGPDLPLIRDWTEEHYDFAGYVTGFDPCDSPTARRSATATTSGLPRRRRRVGRRRRTSCGASSPRTPRRRSACRPCG